MRPEAKARALAERESVDLRLHTIIYEVIAEVQGRDGRLARAGVQGGGRKAAPRSETCSRSRAAPSSPEATSSTGGSRAARQCRLLRDNVVVYTGRVGSLRRFKDDAREVQAGYECGIGLERFNDVKVGDVIECFRMDEMKRTLESAAKAAQPQASA